MGFWIFIILLSVIVAKLEINIEGKDGAAKNLPTWRKENWFTNFVFGNPISGYHLWGNWAVLLMLHLPFFVGLPWNLPFELELFSGYLIFLVLEDFLWFVLNPYYGLKKFNEKNIPWHNQWFGPLPSFYYLVTILGILLAIGAKYLS